MTYTAADLRAKLSDTPRLVVGELVGIGDGSNQYFALAQTPVVAGSYVITPAPTSVEPLSGLVEFATAPAAGVQVKALKYAYTLLSDDALAGIVARQSSFATAMIEAIEAILSRTDFLLSFQVKDKRLDLGQVRRSYEAMLATYRTQAEASAAGDAIAAGGGVNWDYAFDETGRDLTDYAD